MAAQENDNISDYLSAWGWSSMMGVHMALRAAVQLNIPNIISSSGAPLSAADIVSKIPTSDPKAAGDNLERILRFLASKSALSATHKPDDPTTYYGLTGLSRWLVTDAGRPSVAPMLLHSSRRELAESLYRLKDVVLDPHGGGSPFERAYGQTLYDYASDKPEFKNLFHDFMANSSRFFMDMVLKVYVGYENVSELMDVGGGNGTTINQIVSAYPNVRAINFDLPQTLALAPSYPGVIHVAGNMFESLPKAENIQLKNILHNWSDEECEKLLRKCWEALPKDKEGKVIIMEFAVPDEEIGKGEEYARAVESDFYMMLVMSKGKARSIAQFESMAKSAGFSHTNIFHIIQGFYVFEFVNTCQLT